MNDESMPDEPTALGMLLSAKIRDSSSASSGSRCVCDPSSSRRSETGDCRRPRPSRRRLT